jgi:hypothetical protein
MGRKDLIGCGPMVDRVATGSSNPGSGKTGRATLVAQLVGKNWLVSAPQS